MTMHIAPKAHAVDKRDHSAVPCFLRKQTFVVNDDPDMSLSARCQWLDANIYATTSSTPTSWRPRRSSGLKASSRVSAHDQRVRPQPNPLSAVLHGHRVRSYAARRDR